MKLHEPNLTTNLSKSLKNRIIVFYFILFCRFRATYTAYGGSQARGQIRAVAAGLHHSHNNAGSEPHPRPTPQLMATRDP